MLPSDYSGRIMPASAAPTLARAQKIKTWRSHLLSPSPLNTTSQARPPPLSLSLLHLLLPKLFHGTQLPRCPASQGSLIRGIGPPFVHCQQQAASREGRGDGRLRLGTPLLEMSAASGRVNEQLSKKTSIFGLHLGVVVGICVGAAFVLLLFLISVCCTARRGGRNKRGSSISLSAAGNHESGANGDRKANRRAPEDESEEFQEIRAADPKSLAHALQSAPTPVSPGERQGPPPAEEERLVLGKIQIDIGNREHRITFPERAGGSSNSHGSGDSRSAEQAPPAAPEVSHLGWGHWYTLRELEVATNGFADENVIGEGGYGIVYHGVLEDRTQIAVKNLLNNRGQAEREFKVEVEAIGRVRHKNLVRLLGYCAEGNNRMLVYEYVDNGNLEQWLHGDVGPRSPLTWDIRMNIILGTAKGLMYLHEGLEPKVVHRDVKASNILLDQQWNPKVSDFGLAKLLGSERSYVTTRVMGTFGYVAPEYASTGMLNERSDVYSFGILIMEIISGRNPVDYSRPPGEVNLVEWLKVMVSNRNSEGVLDPKLPEHPNSRALKRALLVALRCVDPDSTKRPKMGHVIHMLEVDDFPYRDERRAGAGRGKMQTGSPLPVENRRQSDIAVEDESNDDSGSSPLANRVPRWRKQDD